MNRFVKLVSLFLAVTMLIAAVPFSFAEEVVDADLTCTIILGSQHPRVTVTHSVESIVAE